MSSGAFLSERSRGAEKRTKCAALRHEDISRNSHLRADIGIRCSAFPFGFLALALRSDRSLVPPLPCRVFGDRNDGAPRLDSRRTSLCFPSLLDLTSLGLTLPESRDRAVPVKFRRRPREARAEPNPLAIAPKRAFRHARSLMLHSLRLSLLLESCLSAHHLPDGHCRTARRCAQQAPISERRSAMLAFQTLVSQCKPLSPSRLYLFLLFVHSVDHGHHCETTLFH